MDDPWRIIIFDDSSVVSQRLFYQCKREFGSDLKIVDDIIEIKIPDRESIVIRKEKDRLVCSQTFHDEKLELIFRDNPEWNKKFEAAPLAPKNRKEALEVLDLILSEENKNELRDMKEEELIGLHFGFGMGLRNGFGLWDPESQIVKDYGGGHPDDVSMKLIEEYWARLQAKKPKTAVEKTP